MRNTRIRLIGNWINTGMIQSFRYFCMVNALVVNLIKVMGLKIHSIEKGKIRSLRVCEIFSVNSFFDNFNYRYEA